MAYDEATAPIREWSDNAAVRHRYRIARCPARRAAVWPCSRADNGGVGVRIECDEPGIFVAQGKWAIRVIRPRY